MHIIYRFIKCISGFVGTVDINNMSEAASLVEVVHGVRVTLSLAFCGSDPMHLLPVPDLLAKMNLFIAQVHQVVGVS